MVEISIDVVNIQTDTANIDSTFKRLDFHIPSGKYGKIYVKREARLDIDDFVQATNTKTLNDCTIGIGNVDKLLTNVTITFIRKGNGSGSVKLSIPTLSYNLESANSVYYTAIGWGSYIYKLKLTQPLDALTKAASIRFGVNVGEVSKGQLGAQTNFPLVYITTVDQAAEIDKVHRSAREALHLLESELRNRRVLHDTFDEVFNHLSPSNQMKLLAMTNAMSLRSGGPLPESQVTRRKAAAAIESMKSGVWVVTCDNKKDSMSQGLLNFDNRTFYEYYIVDSSVTESEVKIVEGEGFTTHQQDSIHTFTFTPLSKQLYGEITIEVKGTPPETYTYEGNLIHGDYGSKHTTPGKFKAVQIDDIQESQLRQVFEKAAEEAAPALAPAPEPAPTAEAAAPALAPAQ